MIRDAFHQHFGAADGVRLFRAPGRVNVIGEHTDYNLGFVLPMALDLETTIAAAPAPGGMLRLHSERLGETCEFNAAAIAEARPRRHWSDYVVGVAVELVRAGFPIEPANLLIRSTVPDGSGLSSSAALEVSTALALLRGREMDPLEIARLCQRAERNFVGMPCGIMDQYISVFGKPNAAVEIDCRSLERRYVPLPEDAAFLAVNSMVKHALAGSAYKDRVAECATAVAALAARFPGVASLRDASLEQLETVAAEMPPVVAKRARHVVSENARVNRFVAAGQAGDLALMGRLMVESHRSLQLDYEVSCAELDALVDAALPLEGVFGARMTGGGFGGCVVALLRREAVESVGKAIAEAYRGRYGVAPAVYECRPSAGACEIGQE